MIFIFIMPRIIENFGTCELIKWKKWKNSNFRWLMKFLREIFGIFHYNAGSAFFPFGLLTVDRIIEFSNSCLNKFLRDLCYQRQTLSSLILFSFFLVRKLRISASVNFHKHFQVPQRFLCLIKCYVARLYVYIHRKSNFCSLLSPQKPLTCIYNKVHSFFIHPLISMTLLK